MLWSNILKWRPPKRWFKPNILVVDSTEGANKGFHLFYYAPENLYVGVRPHYMKRGAERSRGLPQYELEKWVDNVKQYSSKPGRFWFYVNSDEDDFRWVDFFTAQPGQKMHGLKIDYNKGRGPESLWTKEAKGPLMLFNTYRGGETKSQASSIDKRAQRIDLYYEGIKPGHEKFRGESRVGMSFISTPKPKGPKKRVKIDTRKPGRFIFIMKDEEYAKKLLEAFKNQDSSFIEPFIEGQMGGKGEIGQMKPKEKEKLENLIRRQLPELRNKLEEKFNIQKSWWGLIKGR